MAHSCWLCGAAAPALHLCSHGTASQHPWHCITAAQGIAFLRPGFVTLQPAALHRCNPSTTSLHLWHCLSAALALHFCITLAAASVAGMLLSSGAGTSTVLLPRLAVQRGAMQGLSCR